SRFGLVGSRPGCGAERDDTVEDQGVDGDHRRLVAGGDEPTDVLGGQQREAGRPVELEQLGRGSSLVGHRTTRTGSDHADGSTTWKRRPTISTGSTPPTAWFG